MQMWPRLRLPPPLFSHSVQTPEDVSSPLDVNLLLPGNCGWVSGEGPELRVVPAGSFWPPLCFLLLMEKLGSLSAT